MSSDRVIILRSVPVIGKNANAPLMKRKVIWLCLLASLYSVQVAAPLSAQPRIFIGGLTSHCDFCMCSQGLSPLDMDGSSIRYDLRYTRLATPFANGSKLPPSGKSETFLTNQFSLTYGLAPGLTASAILPYARKLEASANDRVSSTAIGDVSLMMRYHLSTSECSSAEVVSFTGGVKFATGSTSVTNNGESLDPDIQPGTGTTDFIGGIGYYRSFGLLDLSSNLLAGIRGVGDGASGHVYGNTLNYDLTGRYRVWKSLSSPHAVSGAVGLRGEWRGAELQDHVRLEDSGGNVLYAAPALQYQFANRSMIEGSVWLPIDRQLNGAQLGETVKVLVGAQWGL